MSFKGLTVGVTGLQSQSIKMEVIGNNLANINTTGFKKADVTFLEMYHEVLKGASAGNGDTIGGTNPATVGGGVTIGAITNVFTQGSKNVTGRTLDFMIEGNDFFVAQNAGDGNLILTRNGAFQLDGDMNLVDSVGNKIMGYNVDPGTQVASQTAQTIVISQDAIPPNATSQVALKGNIDSSITQSLMDDTTNGWELFSAGENFGSMSIAIPGDSGDRAVYGSGYYVDGYDYTDTAATVDAGLLDITVTDPSFSEGFTAGDTVSIVQGTTQITRTVSAVNTTTGQITLTGALPGTFAAGAASITNISNGNSIRGSSGALVHNDVSRSQVAMVDKDGNLIASFYRVAGTPKNYTRATAETVSGSDVIVGMGEFSNIKELKEMIELTLRDDKLTNYTASQDLLVNVDKYGKITFGGSGLVEEFRLVMNADNDEMLDRFSNIAITDDAATATTQARVDINGKIIDAPALGLAARTTHTSKNWFDTVGIETYGYSVTNPSTEYGEYAGLRLESGASGTGFGMIQLSLIDGLGNTISQEFKLVARDPNAGDNEFSNMGELAARLQNTLRSQNFSTVAENGVLVADSSVSVDIVDGRLTVSTNSGVFRDLKITTLNTSVASLNDISRSDQMNFETVLGQLAQGINGKAGYSNKFIKPDIGDLQTLITDSQGNEHAIQTYLVRDRSSGLTNIEWKFKHSLNPNLNSFAAADQEDNAVYGNTFNSIKNSVGEHGVLAFDIETGDVLGADAAGSDSRYFDSSNLTFTAATTSQEADESSITIDFDRLTSYNKGNTIIGQDLDGYGMGNLVRLVTGQNNGEILGVYDNNERRVLAKLGLMAIANPEALEKIGSSYFSQTPNSNEGGLVKGIDQIFTAGEGQANIRSKVHGQTLEASNVDLTEELTDMIVTQRSYSASGKVITSSDEMLQEALSLKR